MILLPYGHEQTTVRRLPWVTIGVVALCSLAFLLSGRWRPTPREDLQIHQDVLATVEWYTEHPYLTLPDEFRETFGAEVDGSQLMRTLGYLGQASTSRPTPEQLRE